MEIKTRQVASKKPVKGNMEILSHLYWERISKMSTDIYDKFKIKDVSIEEIEDVICILESNSYQVISSQDSLNGVYVQASMLNHTCFKGPKV